jgi:hypothetical protein
MERIEFNYVFRDGDNEEKLITVSKREEDGLRDYDICEMFMDFMRSVGFSEVNIHNYFNE